MEIFRDAPLLEHTLPMVVSSVDNDNNKNITLRIIPGLRAQKEKLIHFELADDEDSFFLYFLDVGESDFHQLKKEQSILVDFPVFAENLIELILNCSKNDLVTTSLNSKSTFMARLDMNEDKFSIIEANMFKQITHISLKLRRGNDAAIKEYLASRLKYATSKNKQFESDLHQSQMELLHEKSSNVVALKELDTLKTLREVEMQTLRAKHTHEVSTMQVKHMEALTSLTTKYSEDFNMAQNAHETAMQKANTSINELESTLLSFQAQNVGLLNELKDLKKEASSGSSELSHMKTSLEQEISDRRKAEDNLRNRERDLMQLNSKVDSLSQQLKDKDEYILQTVALRKSAEEAKQLSEEKLEMYASTIEAYQEKLQTSAEEMNKGNSIITRLNAERKQMQDKLKMKSEVLRRQEALVTELRSKINELEVAISGHYATQRSTEAMIDTLKQNVSSLTTKLQEAEDVVRSNQAVILYLNQLVNSEQLGGYTPVLDTNVVAGQQMTNYDARSTAMKQPSDATKNAKANGKAYSPDTVIRGADSPPTLADNNYYKSTSTAAINVENDVYLRGMRYLGLGDTPAKLKELGIDLSKDISSLEYYNTQSKPSGITASITTANIASLGGKVGNIGTKSTRYSWQSPDFGLE